MPDPKPGAAPSSGAGQAQTGPAPQTPGSAPGPVAGQATGQPPPAGSQATTAAGQPSATPDSSFFDPSNLPPELMGAYKNMQASYTKRMQELSRDRQKVEAYNAFAADPVGQMQSLARQYGYVMSRPEAAQALAAQQYQSGQTQGQGQPYQPQSWDEVFDRARQMVLPEVERMLEQRYAPILQNVQQMRAASVEQQLDSIDPQWRDYEDRMREMIQRHPTLVGDVELLYRSSVPKEVIESQATQRALKHFEQKREAAQVGEKSTTHTGLPASQKPVTSFNEAVQRAKEILARGG